ncbi:ATP-binding protein [Alkaliphilus hydrothermalis]|uniref:Anti-sigma regulatory factor (Ser/Thr protein kinase) n=1 Tax=Alkaliphilus hydrothermalis TaxID=1482730 RepID=A0ABS2NKV9_9FIRM|nr:anti-sigma regulatory factor [Alkaliphilus hydrothermalis]MBM7613564.1 anti-sigma regulatory factor (Ser/Thr protein kinase) [Alkaliphilus hydrothermalis]
MTIKLSYEIGKNDFAKAGTASSSIKKVLRQLGISADLIRRVAVATYEAEMNIVIHSDGGNIILQVIPEKIQITALDRGPGIADIDMAMKEGYSTAPEEVREMGFGAGMGLPNMKRCADEFSITSSLGNPTELIIVFNI